MSDLFRPLEQAKWRHVFPCMSVALMSDSSLPVTELRGRERTRQRKQ